MKREDVEALLAAAQGAGPADPVFGEELFGVEAPTLAALCRRWLEVEDAEVGRRYAHADGDWIVTPDEDGGVDHPYVRVRIVPEAGQEDPGHEQEGGNGG